MESNNIERLLEKYDNGETSISEEQDLRNYFAQNEIAPHLEGYKVMFNYFANTKEETYTKNLPSASQTIIKPKRNYVYQWISVAAVVVIMFGIFSQINDSSTTNLDELSNDELVAYNQTKQALDLISSKFNEGSASMNVLGIAASQLDKGSEHVVQIKEFSKTTNKIFKNK